MRAKWLLVIAGGLPVLFFLIFGASIVLSSDKEETTAKVKSEYKLTLEKEPKDWLRLPDEHNKSFHYKIPFKVRNEQDDTFVGDLKKTEIVVKEDGKRIKDFELQVPKSDDLTLVLVMDVSGSMKGAKMVEARSAARVFLESLNEQVDVGLVLFNEKIIFEQAPSGNPAQIRRNRQQALRHVMNVKPEGGTAYLDATNRAVEMLQDVKKGRRAIVLMTDGRDVDSDRGRTVASIAQSANAAKDEKGNGIPIYTIGIGKPTSTEPVNTVLVLDKSGSMTFEASRTDTKSKMEALQAAAKRFIDMMPPNAETTLLPFSSEANDKLKVLMPLTGNKRRLKQEIDRLEAQGGTKLFEATLSGLDTLAKADAIGKKYLVVLTDGQDSERPVIQRPRGMGNDDFEELKKKKLQEHRDRRIGKIIAKSKSVQIPLHTLGFGPTGVKARDEGVDESVLQRMANGTGGRYFHARDQKELYKVFENVSRLLHGDGIDEESLRRLAKLTDGEYYHARDTSKLHEKFKLIADELQSTYVLRFPSRFQRADGLKDKIEIYVERDGKRISNVGAGDVTRHGLVIPEIHHVWYLVLLGVLLAFLGLPAGLRNLYRSYGGASST